MNVLKFWKEGFIIILILLLALMFFMGGHRYRAVRESLSKANTELFDAKELNGRNINEVNRLGGLLTNALDDNTRLTSKLDNIERTSGELERTSVGIEQSSIHIQSITGTLKQQALGSLGDAEGLSDEIRKFRELFGEGTIISEEIRARFEDSRISE